MAETPLQKRLKKDIQELEHQISLQSQRGGLGSAGKVKEWRANLGRKRELLANAQTASAQGTARKAERVRKKKVARARRSIGS